MKSQVKKRTAELSRKNSENYKTKLICRVYVHHVGVPNMPAVNIRARNKTDNGLNQA